MYILLLLGLAIAPGAAIAIYIFWQDKFEREPKKHLITCFFLGMISIIPALIFSLSGQSILNSSGSVQDKAIEAFIVVALSEEFSKFIFLRWHMYPKKDFNEPFDGITYAVMVSMGFATLENIMYVYSGGISTALLRMFTAVPAHATFGIMMGYFTGLAKFNKNSLGLLITGVASATLLHGAYDFFLFIDSYPFIAVGALASLIIGIILSLKAIQLHKKNSPFNTSKVS